MICAYFTWKHFKGKQEVRFSSSAILFCGVLTSAQSQVEIPRETVDQFENISLHALPRTASAQPEVTTAPTAVAAAATQTTTAASKVTTATVKLKELPLEAITIHPEATTDLAGTTIELHDEPHDAITSYRHSHLQSDNTRTSPATHH
jgi:hypothetical protein